MNMRKRDGETIHVHGMETRWHIRYGIGSSHWDGVAWHACRYLFYLLRS
jgi:hypothetical protein